MRCDGIYDNDGFTYNDYLLARDDYLNFVKENQCHEKDEKCIMIFNNESKRLYDRMETKEDVYQDQPWQDSVQNSLKQGLVAGVMGVTAGIPNPATSALMGSMYGNTGKKYPKNREYCQKIDKDIAEMHSDEQSKMTMIYLGVNPQKKLKI